MNLEERVERLERQNRVLKWLWAASALVVGAAAA
jgi:hypothetical protein